MNTNDIWGGFFIVAGLIAIVSAIGVLAGWPWALLAAGIAGFLIGIRA